MSNGNELQTSLDEDMEADTQPRHGIKRNRPNDSPNSKDQLISRDVETCGHCKKKCTSTCEALQCDLCSSWVHANCEGVSKKQYLSISQLTNSLDNVMFYFRLNNCVTRSKQFIFASLEAAVTPDANTLQSLVVEQDKIRQTLSKLSQKVNELCGMNQTLEKEIKTASASINQTLRPSDMSNSSPVSTPTPSEVVDEYLDREKRKNNLIKS